MSFLPGFSALWGAWLFLLVLPLVLFYFLKLKRPKMQISSLALWRQVINDQRVNSPFQRFKRNLLLWLQLLMLLLLVLAAMQPFISGNPDRVDSIPVLIDCSASMAALDRPGGESRLDVAKERIRQIIDNLLPSQQMSLIAFHSSARRLTDFTENKHILHSALDALDVSDVPSRIEDALRMTQALPRAGGVNIENVLLFTDGNIPRDVDFELPFELNFQSLPPSGPNIGLTDFNARRFSADLWDVFVRVQSSAADQMAGNVSLTLDNIEIGKQHVVLDAGESERLVFRVSSPQEVQLTARLVPDDADSLETDNVAYLTLPRPRLLTAYVPPDLASYRHALSSSAGIELIPAEGEQTAATLPVYDLIISDDPEHLAVEAGVALYVGIIPDDLKSLVTVEPGTTDVVDWERDATLLQHVQLAEVQSTDEPRSVAETTDGNYEELGYEILAYGSQGPLILKKREGAKAGYYLLFHSDNSTLPYRVAFPILVSNLVSIAMQQSSLSEVRGEPTGVLPPLPLNRSREYLISGPNGFEIEVASDENAMLSGIPVEKVGLYSFTEEGELRKQIGVGLLDSNETGLAAIDEIVFPEEITVSAAKTEVKNDKPLWSMLAMMALGVMVVEWWYYHRRPGGVRSS